jgi:hypothetical protein
MTVYAAFAAGGVSNELVKSAVKRIESVLVLFSIFIYSSKIVRVKNSFPKF